MTQIEGSDVSYRPIAVFRPCESALARETDADRLF